MNPVEISLSVVSHGQGHLIRNLLADCRSFRSPPFEIILTLNGPEDKGFLAEFADLPIRLIENPSPKGFGANHNGAFAVSRGQVFVVVNPDIRAPGFDLGALTRQCALPGVGACAPRVLSPSGRIEDSARRFPTFFRLARRVILRRRMPDYDLTSTGLVQVEWVAGMFVAFPRAAFQAVGGFDTRYFMYLEDTDICRRLQRRRFRVVVDGSASVVHDAQRASHRSLHHLSWHTRSAVRFLTGV